MKKKEDANRTPKLRTFEDALASASKSKSFVKAYNEEVTRLALVREIRELRTKERLTQAALAKKADMPQSVIARIESGQHSFTLETLQRIATVFKKEIRLV